MKFEKALNEYSFDIPLKKWNLKQKNLWMKLVDDGTVKDINDVTKFMKFRAFFDKYYKKNHSFPTVKEVEKVLI